MKQPLALQAKVALQSFFYREMVSTRGDTAQATQTVETLRPILMRSAHLLSKICHTKRGASARALRRLIRILSESHIPVSTLYPWLSAFVDNDEVLWEVNLRPEQVRSLKRCPWSPYPVLTGLLKIGYGLQKATHAATDDRPEETHKPVKPAPQRRKPRQNLK